MPLLIVTLHTAYAAVMLVIAADDDIALFTYAYYTLRHYRARPAGHSGYATLRATLLLRRAGGKKLQT